MAYSIIIIVDTRAADLSMDYQGGAAFLVHMGSLYSIPICVALCIGGSMFLAFLGWCMRHRCGKARVSRASMRPAKPCLKWLAIRESGEAVGTPFAAADAVVCEEQAVGIVLFFRGRQPRIIRSPERLPPILLEVIAF